MDSYVEKGSGALDLDECPPASSETKACNECHTTKTPLWRWGPCGPMSLCNACGIQYRKRREAMGLASSSKASRNNKQLRKKATTAAAVASKWEREREEADEVTMELHAMGFSKEVVLKQRQQMRRRRHLGEEERAAILLMALSSGVVYA